MESLENRRPISEQLVWAVAPTIQIICYLGYNNSLEEVTQDATHELFKCGFRARYTHGRPSIDAYAPEWGSDSAVLHGLMGERDLIEGSG